MPLATETFKEAIVPVIGILKLTSEIFNNCESTPSSSLQIINALGPAPSILFIKISDFSVHANILSP